MKPKTIDLSYFELIPIILILAGHIFPWEARMNYSNNLIEIQSGWDLVSKTLVKGGGHAGGFGVFFVFGPSIWGTARFFARGPIRWIMLLFGLAHTFFLFGALSYGHHFKLAYGKQINGLIVIFIGFLFWLSFDALRLLKKRRNER